MNRNVWILLVTIAAIIVSIFVYGKSQQPNKQEVENITKETIIAVPLNFDQLEPDLKSAVQKLVSQLESTREPAPSKNDLDCVNQAHRLTSQVILHTFSHHTFV